MGHRVSYAPTPAEETNYTVVPHHPNGTWAEDLHLLRVSGEDPLELKLPDLNAAPGVEPGGHTLIEELENSFLYNRSYRPMATNYPAIYAVILIRPSDGSPPINSQTKPLMCSATSWARSHLGSLSVAYPSSSISPLASPSPGDARCNPGPLGNTHRHCSGHAQTVGDWLGPYGPSFLHVSLN